MISEIVQQRSSERNGELRPKFKASKHSRFKGYAAKRTAALDGIALAPVRVVNLKLWWVCIRCMRDTAGVQIERQLIAMRDEYAHAVREVALGWNGSEFTRGWDDWQARRLATLLIFFAYLCQRATLKGKTVWMVRGIPKGALSVATTRRRMVVGEESKKVPHRNTTFGDIAGLCNSGLLTRHQFAWFKVPDWACGKRKLDKDGNEIQWAFAYYFLHVCPFKSGMSGRFVTCPDPCKADPTQMDPHPQLNIDAAKQGRDPLEAERAASREPERVNVALLPRPKAAVALPEPAPKPVELESTPQVESFEKTLVGLEPELVAMLRKAFAGSDDEPTGGSDPPN